MEATWKLEENSKDSDSTSSGNVSSQQVLKNYWEKRRDDSLMLVTIHDDMRNVLNMQKITQNSKRWDYLHVPGGGT